MRRFDFVENKPTLIDLKSSDAKIRQSASQMITLITELPLLLGDRIPEDDENWNSFLILLKICKIALSPRCTPDTIAYLRVLIEEKLFVFKKLYPDRRITPKMHYMLHYPAQIEKYGPLIHTWTMRNEAKLSFIKQASRTIINCGCVISYSVRITCCTNPLCLVQRVFQFDLVRSLRTYNGNSCNFFLQLYQKA